jgi:transposase
VVQQPRLFLGQDHDVPRSVSESLEHGISLLCAFTPVNTMLIIGIAVAAAVRLPVVRRCPLGTKGPGREGGGMDWEDRLDDWEVELEFGARLDGSDWVTLERAAAETGVSRAALRTWYRTEQIPSRLVDGPHGPQRLVPLAVVAERAEASPRVRKTAERRLADEAQIELLRHRIDQLERRLADLERRLGHGQEAGLARDRSADS